MSLRTRILLASLVLVWVPLLLLGLGVRAEMSRRLTEEYTQRTRVLWNVTINNLHAREQSVGRQLDALAARLAADNRFRLAAVNGLDAERPYLIDYAGSAMELLGLDMLQIQDEEGRILSSGHFRNLYDHLEPALPWYLNQRKGFALAEVTGPEGTFLTLARSRVLEMRGCGFTLVGGVQVDDEFLRTLLRDEQLNLVLYYSGGAITNHPPGSDLDARARLKTGHRLLSAQLSFIRAVAEPGSVNTGAYLDATYSFDPLDDLKRNLDLWLGGVLAVGVLGSLLLAFWFSGRISRPIADLAHESKAVDLDRPATRFDEDRRDEVGTLARVLNAMTDRLRAGAAQLRDAERRATRGEMARQVNHDIRNGLTPIRNVFRHLAQVARDDPARLPEIFVEREPGLEAGMEYLEDLAANYARLSLRAEPRLCDLNEVAEQVVSGVGTREGLLVRVVADPGLPRVMADPVALRRIVENLVRNAVEALGDSGEVEVATSVKTDDDGARRVVVTVTDTGPGIPDDIRERIFDDFYTTKGEGAGLGLSIVRRLVTDLEGTVRVESEPGQGSRFTVRLPAGAPGGDA